MNSVIKLTLLCLIIFTSSQGKADDIKLHKQKMHNWLTGQIVNLDQNSSLITSYTGGKRSFTYDQALATIYFSRSGYFDKAAKLLKGFEKIQLDDGSWYFSYYLDGTSPYPENGDYRPNGAIAWMILAIITYEIYSQDIQFRQSWVKGLSYLKKQITKFKLNNDAKKVYALPFSSVNYENTAWDQTNITPLEHAVDALSAFRAAQKIQKNQKWKTAQEQLERFSLALWDESRQKFWGGAKISTGTINKGFFYLDNQTWTALALEHLPIKNLSKKALNTACEQLVVQGKFGAGFSEGKSSTSHAKFVWSEGSAGKALTLKRLDYECEKISHEEIIQTLLNMQTKQGGIYYIDRLGVDSFAHKPSVAGTVWTLFAIKNINPFSP